MLCCVPPPPGRCPLTAAGQTSSAVNVAVCTGSLCVSQDGMNALELLRTLREQQVTQQLPFPVKESSCLGACGIGAMVQLDFADGHSSIVAGLDETLDALGLQNETPATQAAAPPITARTQDTLPPTKDHPENPVGLDARDRMRASAARRTASRAPLAIWGSYVLQKMLGTLR